MYSVFLKRLAELDISTENRELHLRTIEIEVVILSNEQSRNRCSVGGIPRLSSEPRG